jgi:hypothetical protein
VGHKEEDCRAKPCPRCGYKGHKIEACYSVKAADGKRLTDTPPGKAARELEEAQQSQQRVKSEKQKSSDFR